MNRIILMSVLLLGLVSAKSQILINSDSMIVSLSDVVLEKFNPVTRVAEKLQIEIDKDLMTLKIFGKEHEHAAIETAYIIDLLEVDKDQLRWMFQGEDNKCISYTITLDLVTKRVDFLTFRKEANDTRILTRIYYPVVDVKINKEAIDAHLAEKYSNK